MFSRNKPVVKFKAVTDHIYGVFDPPYPAKKNIPEWYKRQNKYIGGTLSIGDNGNPNHTIKACMPVFDMMTGGYIIPLPADIHVSRNEDGAPYFKWSTNHIHSVESHSIDQYDQYELEPEYFPGAFKFIQPWVIETPPGYSAIFLHPTNREFLPFKVIPAIVDTDKHPIKINFPFFLRNDFEGLIPMGTPIAQMIPFKRENWKSEVSENIDEGHLKRWYAAERKVQNRYKTFFRTLKNWD